MDFNSSKSRETLRRRSENTHIQTNATGKLFRHYMQYLSFM